MAQQNATELPDWNALRDVLVIAEAGSLSGAARVLRVSQSTMSRRLAAIEAGGLPVFQRAPKSGATLTVTARGAHLLAAAREMRAAYRQAADAVSGAPPPLRIASCEVTGRLFLADALPVWSAHAARPAEHAVYDDLFALPGSDYDVLVTPFDSVPARYQGERIGGIIWALFAAEGYLQKRPLAKGANNLAGHSVIRASGSLADVGAYLWLDRQGGSTVLLSSSPMAQLEACARGQGIALLPENLASADTRLTRLQYATPDPSEVWLVADATEASHPRIASFLRWARAHFRAVAAEGPAIPGLKPS